MSDNMKLWDSVSKTDPAHTKKVNQRGGFTAIDAHYQVMQATKAFGPVGKGWGYECEHGLTDDLQLAWCDVWVWWRYDDGDLGGVFRFGPVRGMCKCKTGDRIDQDAGKKAMTDALTKGLSHLGFSADVFLGLFDDNKYVATRELEEKAGHKDADDRQWVVTVLLKMKDKAKTKADLDALASKVADKVNAMSAENITYFTTEYNAIKEKLG